MKKITLFAMAVAATMSLHAAYPDVMDISTVLSKNAMFSFDLGVIGEQAYKGAVADFNADGYDDFILTGLYKDGDIQKGFLRVYYGNADGNPTIAYQNDEFPIAGNGGLDIAKIANNEYLVAIQGGAAGNWTNQFKGAVYKLTATATSATVALATELNSGGGRGSILLLDMNNDTFVDIFQNGWNESGTWTNLANCYINDQTNEWFDLADSSSIRPASNLFSEKADFNNDGKLDLLLPIKGVGLLAYINQGDGTFQEVVVDVFPKAERTDGRNIRNDEDTEEATVLDFNNDGYLDIVLAGTNDASNPWEFILFFYKNNGDGTFTRVDSKDYQNNPIDFFGGQRADFAVADFDLDGNVDFIMGCENEKEPKDWGCRTFFFKGNGQGGFDQKDITYNSETATTGIVPMCRRAQFGRYLVGDFNGDKKQDVLVAGSDYYGKVKEVNLFLNVCTPTAIERNAVSNISIEANNHGIMVSNAAGKLISVYNLLGAKVMATIADSDCQSIALQAENGVYIVKVEDTVCKVIVK